MNYIPQFYEVNYVVLFVKCNLRYQNFKNYIWKLFGQLTMFVFD